VSGPVRAFLAFEIPDGVRARIAAACDELRSGLPTARWTRPQSWHLTLKFLGEAPPGVLAALTASLGPAVEDFGIVSVRLHGSGFFPSPANPRVAWIGGDAVNAAAVVAAVEEAAAAAGFERERRPWSPHLTLARLRSRWSRAAVDRFLEWGGELRLDGFECAELVLFESSLEPGGAVYTPLQRIPLV
jgi:RNA 2',3'-cyclic 3'-phosphodiesterase